MKEGKRVYIISSPNRTKIKMCQKVYFFGAILAELHFNIILLITITLLLSLSIELFTIYTINLDGRTYYVLCTSTSTSASL